MKPQLSGSDALLQPMAQWCNEFMGGYLAALGDLAQQLGDLVRVNDFGHPRLSVRSVERLAGVMTEHLRDADMAIGHGFIAAPGVVDDLARFMAWLQRDGSSIKRLRLNFDTEDLDAYDYVNMDWYLTTVRQRGPTLTGPYLDYAGAGRLVMTITTTLMSADDVIGVVGTDLLADEVEAAVSRCLCAVDADVVLVSSDRTVVATNSERWVPGERMASHPAQTPKTYSAVAALESWTGWTLAAACREP